MNRTRWATHHGVITLLATLSLLLSVGLFAIPTASAADGPYGFPNSAIADRAEAYANGVPGGQCLVFVTNMIKAAGGPQFYFGNDTSTYQSQWAQRAAPVGSLAETQRGDIVQWGGGAGGTLDPHTAIITVGGSNPQVIDSNYSVPGGIGRGSFSSRNPAGSSYRLWRVGRGSPSQGGQQRFIADVDGDHRADVVMYHPADASWSVAQSSGSGFFAPTAWTTGRRTGSTRQFVADVNGDDKADVITFFGTTGDWWVGLSSGSGFWPETQWASGHGAGSTNQFVADVNGDGRADEIAFWNGPGDWRAGLSSGSGFWPMTLWATGPGYRG